MRRKSCQNIPGNVVNAIRRLVEKLEEKGIRVGRAYLFGSYARGDWLKNSDIDLVIVSRSFEKIPFNKRLDIVNEIIWEERIKPYIEVLPYTPKELEEKIKKKTMLMDASKYWIPLDDLLSENKC